MRRHLPVLLALAACGAPAPKPRAQPDPPHPQAPKVDADRLPVALAPQIRLGTLPNGLTFYVMQHKKPEQRASLWLAVNAGSVQEDDDQRGLAHFVEHMAFNGTRRFPKQAIVDYIEKVGMRFGADVNAYTSFDQTVYQLTVPTDDRPTMMTGLDILRDWAGDVTLDPVEVDKERGVVLEEWRLGRGAFARIDDKQWPVMFQGSRYATRLPIGLPEIIKGAPRDTLMRFYKDWYRPQNMAVIAVGDFDAAAMEQEIRARFGDLAAGDKARVREPAPVPRDHPALATIATDPEMPYTQVAVYDKMDHRAERTRGDYRRGLVESIYHVMLRARFDELAFDPASPFVDAGSYTSDLARTADGFVRSATAKQGRAGEALVALFREIARVEQHGFLPSELARAKTTMLANMETSAAEWDKAPSDEITDEMTRHFFTGEQMPGRTAELAMYRELLPGITLAELDHLARTWGGERGRVITMSGPAGTKLPLEGEALKIAKVAGEEKLAPWRDEPPKPLLAAPPKPGTTVATKQDPATGATAWTLSNGVRVVVKPTDFQNDSIEISGFQKGGASLVADVVHGRFADDVVARGGAGDLDAVQLRKALAGKVASAGVYLGESAEGAWGSARPADLETALQLLYVKLTAPRRDERAFASWKAEQLELARNRRLSPERSFYEDMGAIRSGDHPRRRPTTPEMIEQIDLDKSFAVWRERFSDLGGFTFIIVGNVDLAKLQPLAERYLGGLPSSGRRQTWKDVGIAYPKGVIEKKLALGSEPKSFVSITYGAPDAWSRDGDRDAAVLSSVLRIRLREVLREDMGGVYGVRVGASLMREPVQRREVTISFGCDPANVDKLRAAVLSVMHAIQKDGIGADYLAKVTEQFRRTRETDVKDNEWWSSTLQSLAWYGDEFGSATDLSALLARATPALVKASAKRFLDEKHAVIGVMVPAPK